MPDPILPFDVRVSPSAEELARAAAHEVTQLAARAVETRGSFRLALAGGTTPRRLYELLADTAAPGAPALPWPSTEVFFSDERFVPANDADSNFRMAR
jgi:6-phosphogluconolactonase